MSKLTSRDTLLAKHELWRRGELSWKMHGVQKDMTKIFYSAPKNSTLVWLLSRQTGKSWLITFLALEAAIRKPNSIVKILTDTKVHAKTIFNPIFTKVLEDCPDDIKPTYLESQYLYNFANGSQIQLAGSDGGHYERLRGQRTDLVLVDEAGFCDNLEHVVKSILLPTLLHSGGNIVLSSTPPSDPDHDFFQFQEKAEMEKMLTKKTIYDNPLLDKDQIERIIKESGGITSPSFRREWLCEPVRDEKSTVFPEFDEEMQNRIIKDHPKPPHYDTYVGMDLGYKDLTAVIFLYYDFRVDKIVVEDEIVVAGQNLHLSKLTEDILKKEESLWKNIYTGEVKKPIKRVSDINLIVTQEINKHSNYQLNFQPANKYDANTSINQLRMLLANEKIIISPRCVNLIRHLKNCKWKNLNEKSTFARSPDDGHYDTVDALRYAIREINFNRNPYPQGSGGMSIKQINGGGSMTNINFVPNNNTDPLEVYKRIFGRRK